MVRSIRFRTHAIGVLVSLSMLMGWSAAAFAAEDAKAPDCEAIVAAPDRSDADRQTDVRRQPAKMLAFTGIESGMKVLDMEANAGLVGEADFLRRPEDPRDAAVFRPQVPTYEFVLKYQKPS